MYDKRVKITVMLMAERSNYIYVISANLNFKIMLKSLENDGVAFLCGQGTFLKRSFS